MCREQCQVQIAEEYLRKLGGDDFVVESAGIEPGKISPLVIKVMLEEGIDLSDRETRDIWVLCKKERVFDWVITVCDRKWEDKFPTFPGIYKRDNRGFPDPASVEGSENEKLQQLREIRDKIKLRVKLFIDDVRTK